jgi:hypothetical protein
LFKAAAYVSASWVFVTVMAFPLWLISERYEIKSDPAANIWIRYDRQYMAAPA